MKERVIDLNVVVDVLETGQARWKDGTRGWVAKQVAGRHDNLICLVVALEQAVVVKTVMHHFEWEA